MDKAVCEFPPGLGDGGEFQPFGAPFTEGWKTKDLSRSGVIGDAAAATAEDGRAWFEAGARSLAARIVELAERVAGARSEPRG
jgi:creatinine amidohydrolase